MLKDECDRLNEVFFYFIQTRRPYVAMKYAMTMDGKIATYSDVYKRQDLNYCKNSYEEPVEYALSNSLGFGGHNASILLKAYKDVYKRQV